MTNVVKVTIDNGYNYKRYNFFTDVALVEGDKVVADTVNGLVIGTVQGEAAVGTTASRWIIQKIDMTDHKERQEKKKRAAEIKKKLTARRRQIEEQEVLKLLASKDEEFAELLNELQQLQGDN